MKLGATGKYPDGSIGRHDEGELRFGVARDNYGNVRIDFGKPVAWMAFPPEQAIEIAKLILKHVGATKIEISFGTLNSAPATIPADLLAADIRQAWADPYPPELAAWEVKGRKAWRRAHLVALIARRLPEAAAAAFRAACEEEKP